MLRSTKLRVCVLVMVVVTLINLAATLRSQEQKDLGLGKSDDHAQRARKEELQRRFPITDFEASEPAGSQGDAKRKARNRRHNKSFWGVKGGMNALPDSGTESVLTNDWEVRVPRIPAPQSDVIAVGTILDARAYISDDRNGVYSEFTLQVEDVLKSDNVASLPVNKRVSVEREGGRVRFPSGRVEWYRIALQSMPVVDCRYVLFLKRLDSEGFSIITGYELKDGRVHPLDAEASQFGVYDGMDEASFLKQVREAIAVQ